MHIHSHGKSEMQTRRHLERQTEGEWVEMFVGPPPNKIEICEEGGGRETERDIKKGREMLIFVLLQREKIPKKVD